VGLFADRLARGGRPTGVGAYVAGIATGLSARPRAHEFVLFSTPESSPAPAGVYGQVRVATLPWPRRPVQAAWCLTRRPRVKRIGGALDLLHVLVPSVPVPTALPLVTTIHDLMPLKLPGCFSRRDRALFRLAVQDARRRARRVIVPSEATRRDVVELLGLPEERTVVVPYGAPRDLRRPSPNAIDDVLARHGVERPFVLFVGEVAHRKNPLVLVEAFARIVRSTGCRLVFAGPPGLGADDVVERVRRLGLSDRVVFLGRVPRRDVAALMSAAATLVLPSADEGFGFPALEAMLCGAPVIVSDRGALPEVVGDAGVVVPGPDADGIADAMLSVLGDDTHRADLARRGSARAAAYTWERSAEQTLAVYEDAVAA
jgi:glycosyltransferase involved in cell wall biosynthesis